MLTALLSPLLGKILGTTFMATGLVGIVAAVSEVTGSSPHSVLNTLLNLLAAPAALVAAWAVRQLRTDTERGDTAAGRDIAGLRQDIGGLRSDVRALSTALASRS